MTKGKITFPISGKLTYEHLPVVYKKFSEDLSGIAVQRTYGKQTMKGYDTTGYGYQFVVNRLNEVVFGHWRVVHELIETTDGKTKRGQPLYRRMMYMKIQLGNWNGDNFEVIHEVDGYGGHESIEEASALKGAYTNTFKKVAAMLGIGKRAFEGLIDTDNISYQQEMKEDGKSGGQIEVPPKTMDQYEDLIKDLTYNGDEQDEVKKKQLEKWMGSKVKGFTTFDEVKPDKLGEVIKWLDGLKQKQQEAN